MTGRMAQNVMCLLLTVMCYLLVTGFNAGKANLVFILLK